MKRPIGLISANVSGTAAELWTGRASLEAIPELREILTTYEKSVADYQAALRDLSRTEERFDLLFVDPPYRMLADVSGRLAPVLPRVLCGAGLAVIEGPRGVAPEVGVPVLFQRRYGDTVITVVGREEATT